MFRETKARTIRRGRRRPRENIRGGKRASEHSRAEPRMTEVHVCGERAVGLAEPSAGSFKARACFERFKSTLRGIGLARRVH